ARAANVQLGELINAALEQRRELDTAELAERLKPVSVAAVAEPLEDEYMVLNAPFLVARDGVDEFEDAVEQLAEEREGRMRVTLLGPMPVYNFLDIEEPAWA